MIQVWLRFTPLDLHNYANFAINLNFFLFFFFFSSSFDEINTQNNNYLVSPSIQNILYKYVSNIMKSFTSFLYFSFFFVSFFFTSFDDNRLREYKKANQRRILYTQYVWEFLGKITEAYIQYKHAPASSPSGEYAFMLKNICYKWTVVWWGVWKAPNKKMTEFIFWIFPEMKERQFHFQLKFWR